MTAAQTQTRPIQAGDQVLLRVVVGKTESFLLSTVLDTEDPRGIHIKFVSPNEDDDSEDWVDANDLTLSSEADDKVTFKDRAATGLKYGIPVVPVGTDSDPKKPFLKDWQNLATINPEQIERWNIQYPDKNCGMVAKSQPGGFWCLEVDSTDVGKRYKKDTGNSLPSNTLVVQSRPGRDHRWYRHNAASIAMGNLGQNDVLHNDFSVRAHNEQAVSPRSFRSDLGIEYTLIRDVEPTEAPSELIAWLIKQKTSGVSVVESRSGNPGAIAEAPIPKGTRNASLASLAGSLHHKGLSDDLVLQALLEANDNRCEPPLSDDEVKGIAKSICGYDTSGDIQAGVILNGSGPTQISEWRVPELFDNALLPVQPFKLEFLPSSLQPWAQDVSERMSVPLDFVGVCMLCALAGCINRRAFVYPKANDKDWKEAIAISGAVVSYSGKMKTPTWKTSINPMQEIDIDWQNEHKARLAVYKSELKTYEESEKLRKKEAEKLRKKDQSDAGALFASTAAKPLKGSAPPLEPESCRRLVVNDATPEKFHDIMTTNPEGLFVYRDELSSWVAELDQKGREAERGMFLAAMNGSDAYTLDRIGRGSLTAIMSASLFGGFQPEPLIKFLCDSRNKSDGMLARFGALVWPDDSVIPSIDRAANSEAKDRFRRTIRVLSELRAESVALHFSTDAQQRFNDWLSGHVSKVNKETNAAKQSHLSKYRGLLPKLAGLLQLADLVASLPSVGGGHTIDLDHLDRAIALLAYLETHMNRIYGCVKSPVRKAEEALAQHVQAGDLKDGFRIRDVQRKCWENLSKDYCEDAILALEDMGWFRQLPPEQTSKGGRPTLRWEINPSLTLQGTDVQS